MKKPRFSFQKLAFPSRRRNMVGIEDVPTYELTQVLLHGDTIRYTESFKQRRLVAMLECDTVTLGENNPWHPYIVRVGVIDGMHRNWYLTKIKELVKGELAKRVKRQLGVMATKS